MEKTQSFRQYYEKDLLPELKTLDCERKKVDRRVTIIGLLAVLAIFLETRFLNLEANEAMMFIQLGTALIGILFISLAGKGYRKKFKEEIISRIVLFVDESLIYNHQGKVSKSEFIESNIFQHRCDVYHGEDYVQGKIGKTQIEFSEIKAQYRQTTGSGSKTNTRHVTFFKGIFFIADFNKHFNSRTIVLPDFSEKTFGKIGQKLQSLNFTRGKLIKLENPEFEKEFVVYGEDQLESRYILSPSLMERILNFKKKWNSKVYLSFHNSKVYIAIWMNKNLFETRLFKSIVDYSFIEKNVQYLLLLTGIVNDLNLNTRIWSKK